MAKAPKEVTNKQHKHKYDNDIYTALLGLAMLTLAATAVFACLRSVELYEKIFSF